MRVPPLPFAILPAIVCCAPIVVGPSIGAVRASSLPAFQGRVERFTLGPNGDVDGLLLTDGTEVETPPHLSAEMTDAVRPGDLVTVWGLKAASILSIQAVEVQDQRTGRSVLDRGLSAGPRPNPPPPGEHARREGRVRRLLHGMQGEANGLLLDDGTIIRMDPATVSDAGSIVRPGAFVVAEGEIRTSSWGTVLRATAIGARAPGGG